MNLLDYLMSGFIKQNIKLDISNRIILILILTGSLSSS